LNEQPVDVADGATADAVAAQRKPDADLFIVNGFPVDRSAPLRAGDRLVLIHRGEVPPDDELEALMVARHTPGIHALLKRATVAIAGCGGLGSTVALALARVGVGCLILADFDVVEPSNLNRQQYFVDQIGMLKVEALKATIARVSRLVVVEPHALRLTAQNVPAILGRADVIVEAFDRADQKEMLVSTLLIEYPQKPIVLGVGMAGWGANALLHARKVDNLYVCGDETMEAGPYVGLMAPRVGVAACLQANQVMEILLGPDPAISNAASASRRQAIIS